MRSIPKTAILEVAVRTDRCVFTLTIMAARGSVTAGKRGAPGGAHVSACLNLRTPADARSRAVAQQRDRKGCRIKDQIKAALTTNVAEAEPVSLTPIPLACHGFAYMFTGALL